MNAKQWIGTAAILAWSAGAAWPADRIVGQRAIDPRSSTMTIRVSKSGLFSAFGHNHQISAPVAGGTVDLGARRAELRVDAKALRVRDQDVTEKDRAAIQKTMLGPEVLDADRYPEIVFHSTSADSAGAGAWNVRGELTLHGQTRPVVVVVKDQKGRYVGATTLKQSVFGIKPIKVAGGAVRVKDEVRIQFDIRLAGSAEGK